MIMQMEDSGFSQQLEGLQKGFLNGSELLNNEMN